MKLIIAEKKQLAEAIATAISDTQSVKDGVIYAGDYAITYTGGHALTLLEPEEIDEEKYKSWNIEQLPIMFSDWKKKPAYGKEKRVEQIGQLLDSCDSVVNAGDIDDEGQLLVDEILDYFKYKGKVERLDTSNTNPKVLSANLQKMDDNKDWRQKGLSALARSIADKSFGYTMTRFFTCINDTRNVVHVGRVKIPTLGLVVNRDALIDNHVTINYYDLQADLKLKNDTGEYSIKALLRIDKESDLLDDGKVLDKKILEKIADEIKGEKYSGDVKRVRENEQPPLPFNLSELQLYCSSKYKYSPSETLEITQKLRDNYNAISYNRTDCQYLSEQHYREAPETLDQVMSNLGVQFPVDTKIKSKAFNDSYITAHFGIVPHNEKVNIGKMTEEERNVYEAICLFYIAQFLPCCVKEKSTFTAQIDSDKKFQTTSMQIIDEGYRQYLKNVRDNSADNSEGKSVNSVPEGEYEVSINNFEIQSKQSKPPKRYTEATLADDMSKISKYVENDEIKEILKRKDKDKKGENGSIGTPATRATIIKELLQQGYLLTENNNIKSTEKAKSLIATLPAEIKLPDTTARWWVYQEDIMLGNKMPEDLLNNVCAVMTNVMDSYKSKNISVGVKKENIYDNPVVGKCPLCGNSVLNINREKLKAYKCANIDCNFIIFKNSLKANISAVNAKKLIEGKETAPILCLNKEKLPYYTILYWQEPYKKLGAKFISKKNIK